MKRLGGILSFLLLAALVAGGAYLQRESVELFTNKVCQNLFSIQKIDLQGNFYRSKEELLATLPRECHSERPWLWEIDFGSLKDKLEQNPWVESARLNWHILPIRLSIQVKEADPWLVVEDGSNTWLVSRRGDLLSPLSSLSTQDLVLQVSELARLDGVTLPQAAVTDSGSQQKADELATALRLLTLFERSFAELFRVERYRYRRAGELEIFPFDIHRYPKILFSAEDYRDARERIAQLKIVLDDLENRKEQARIVDLRFSAQAVVRK